MTRYGIFADKAATDAPTKYKVSVPFASKEMAKRFVDELNVRGLEAKLTEE